MTRTRSTSPAVRPETMTSRGPAYLPSYRRTSVAVVVAAVLAATAASAASAQEDSTTAQQVQALKKQVEELQRRLDALQGIAGAASKPANAAQPPSAAQPSPTATTASHAAERPKAQQTAQAPGEAEQPPRVQPIGLASTYADYQQSSTEPGGYGAANSGGPGLQAGPLTITVGGFTELAIIDRHHTEYADVGSVPFSSLPFPDVEQWNVTEFRESARQSRFSLLTQAAPWNGAATEAYFETDFLGAANTANSRESNSYNLRMRAFYARFMLDSGFSILAGQNWSLATLYKEGLDARQEDVPLTIDAQYVAGFNWTRNPQLRFVQKFNKMFSLGFSAESPQAVVNSTNNVPATSSTGGTISPYPANALNYPAISSASGLLNNTTNYSIDPAPDLILKAALDPGFGHYEVYGLQRWFRSAVGTDTNTVSGTSVGAGAILPVVPDIFSFQASGLVGKGVGRYGSAQLPDVTVEPNGDLSPLKGYQLLFGAFVKPIPSLQIYGYAGREQVTADYFEGIVSNAGVPTLYAYGYGNPLYNNSGCYTLGGKCTGNPQTVEELTGGFWWKYYQGELGNLQFGLQFAYDQLNAFEAIKGGSPTTNDFETMISFRYYPYQK